ncbi:hypothetical protein AVEN_269723-1 [Araneus ventricosus]|uniref:Uncharacterized protein n=2 Tax=Araneus ventricosus TaxID=182803 RepID=A0A4Y1ZUS1_ARAVE|nr:hypothetical protein AVEN_269723-1 [Araneus ventricosus]
MFLSRCVFQCGSSMMGIPTLHQRFPPTPNLYIWTALDLSWWSSSLACYIAGPIMSALLLLGSTEDIGVRDHH